MGSLDPIYPTGMKPTFNKGKLTKCLYYIINFNKIIKIFVCNIHEKSLIFMFAYINKNNIVYLKLKFICKNSCTWTTINMNKIIILQLLLISAKWKYTDVTTADTLIPSTQDK